MAHVDKDERYLFVNEKLARQFRKSVGEMVGSTLRELQPAALYASNKPHIDLALSGQTTIFESQSNLSGSNRYYQVTYIPDVGSDGQVGGFYAMVIDITEIKTNELRQAASEKRLKTITDNVPVSISYIDAEQRFQFANATMYLWTATTPDRLIGKRASEVLDPTVYEERRDYFDRVLAGEQVEFIQTSTMAETQRVMQSIYIPDRAEDGEVKGFYTLSSDISALKKTEEHLTQLARFDALTGLKNRTSLFEEIQAVLARSRRDGTALAILYLDVDHFKSINDTLGHAKGDLVLQEFARRLNLSVRSTDTVARLGGDEFVIVLESLKSEVDGRAVAQKILDHVRTPWLMNGERLTISTSIGMYYDVTHALSPTDLLKCADELLYKAKNSGRDRFFFGTDR